MKILIVCSKAFYPRIEEIKNVLEARGIEIVLPNTYDNPKLEHIAIKYFFNKDNMQNLQYNKNSD